MTERKIYIFTSLVVVIIFFGLYFLLTGGGATPTTTASAGVVTSSARFWVLFILGGVILAIWAAVNYSRYPTGTARVERLKGCAPPAWAFVIFLGITSFHWLFWAIAPENWSAWLRSASFWPINIATVLAVFFTTRQGKPAGYASFALWVLLLATIGIGAYRHFPRTAGQVPSAMAPDSTAISIITAEAGKWSKIYHFPPGMMVEWRALDPEAHYCMKIQTGVTYCYSPEKSEKVAGVVASASFIGKRELPEKIRIRLYR